MSGDDAAALAASVRLKGALREADGLSSEGKADGRRIRLRRRRFWRRSLQSALIAACVGAWGGDVLSLPTWPIAVLFGCGAVVITGLAEIHRVLRR